MTVWDYMKARLILDFQFYKDHWILNSICLLIIIGCLIWNWKKT